LQESIEWLNPVGNGRRFREAVVELDAMLVHIQTMRNLLDEQGKCRCTALEECGKKIFEKQCRKRLSY